MSLLLDALKKAAEKNAKKDASVAVGSSHAHESRPIDQTVVVDNLDQAADITVAQPTKKPIAENITEMELAKIIDAQKNITAADESLEESVSEQTQIIDNTDLSAEELSIANVGSDPSLSLFNDDEDMSLSLSASGEEVVLTDDDVTEFLGSDDISLRLEDVDSTKTGERNFMDDDTELKLVDKTITQSLNLDDSQVGFSAVDKDITYQADHASIVENAGHTTDLNNLTNDVTVIQQDQTSTETFASDNYDRTLVKLDDDVSKVFTGMKSAGSGAAMTPDFAKKVFIHKSTTLRQQNYKIYTLISVILLTIIAVLALFKMQTQIDDIDTSLVRLKQNPVPSELRYKREEKKNNELAVLQGRVDTEALNLLKSLTKENNASIPAVSKVKIEKNIVEEPMPVKEAKAKEVKEQSNDSVDEQLTGINESKPVIIAKSKGSLGRVSNKKSVIKIETKRTVSKESIWLKEAYSAFEQGNTELAAMNYAKVLEKDSKNRDALLGQAAIFVGQNKNSQAIDNYQAVLLENPKDSLAMSSLIAASTMSPIESESRLKLLLRESPKATYLQFALGNAISAQNRWQEAQQYYFMAFQTEPKNPDYAYNLAISLEQINKQDIAVKYYEQAVKNAQFMQASFDVALTQQRIEVLKQ